MTSPTLLKLLAVLIVFAIFYFLGKKAKGGILAVLLYMLIPTPDDILVVPAIISFLALALSVSLVIAGITYYLGLIIAIIIVLLAKNGE